MSLEKRTKKSGLSRGFAVGVSLAASSLVLSGCSKVSGLGYEEGLSSVNDTSLGLWQGAWIAAGVVGIFTAGLIFWALIFHRKKNEEFPKQTQYHVPVEIAYTLIPLIIVAVLFAYTVRDQSKITKKTTGGIAHEMTVNAIQWSWQFHYSEAGPDAIVTGTPEQVPVLYMPQGEKVRFNFTSSDVVHGFWIPAFMIQIQNLPGVTNHLEFTANKLGDFIGRCNILCGRDHSRMRFTVRVVTPSQYQDYLSTLKAS